MESMHAAVKENQKPQQNVPSVGSSTAMTPYTDADFGGQGVSSSMGGINHRRGSGMTMGNSRKVSGLTSINL